MTTKLYDIEWFLHCSTVHVVNFACFAKTMHQAFYFLKLPRAEQVSMRTGLDFEKLLGKNSALNRTKMSRKQKLTIAKDWNSVEQLSSAAFRHFFFQVSSLEEESNIRLIPSANFSD